MSDGGLEQALEERVRRQCGEAARYPVLFVWGPARSGKSQLVQALCTRTGWLYLNYTADPDGLERIRGREMVYGPDEFLADLRATCARRATGRVVVCDEIEPLLSRWRREKQELFFRLVGRATGLAAGVVLVTRLWNSPAIADALRPDRDRVFDIVIGD